MKKEEQIRKKVRALRQFYRDLITFCVGNLAAFNLEFNPDQVQAVFTVSVTFGILKYASVFFCEHADEFDFL